LLKTFRSKIQKFGLKVPHLEQLRKKIEILTTNSVVCQKFATFCSCYF